MPDRDPERFGEVPRPRSIPYGLHPMIDLQLMMNSLADNQLALAKLQRGQTIAIMIVAIANMLLWVAVFLPRLVS